MRQTQSAVLEVELCAAPDTSEEIPIIKPHHSPCRRVVIPAWPQGNAHAKRSTTDQLAPQGDSMRTGSPPMPGSPLTYSPQLPMTPQQSAAGVGPHNGEYSGVAGWPAQPKLLPTVIICESFPSCPL